MYVGRFVAWIPLPVTLRTYAEYVRNIGEKLSEEKALKR
jgi:hypothetical protein